MDCHECNLLGTEYHRLEHVYATVNGLLKEPETIERTELYLAVKRTVDEAALEVEVARLALERHQSGQWRAGSICPLLPADVTAPMSF